MKPAFLVSGFSCSQTTRKKEITDINSHTIKNMIALFAQTTNIIEIIKILYRKPRWPIFFFPKYSLTYPVENIETANTDIDITRMKKADSLSTKNPNFRYESCESVK